MPLSWGPTAPCPRPGGWTVLSVRTRAAHRRCLAKAGLAPAAQPPQPTAPRVHAHDTWVLPSVAARRAHTYIAHTHSSRIDGVLLSNATWAAAWGPRARRGRKAAPARHPAANGDSR